MTVDTSIVIETRDLTSI